MDKYWKAKAEFESRLFLIISISGLTIDGIANDNMLTSTRLTKVAKGYATFTHDEFIMIVWYMSQIPSDKDLVAECKLVIEERRKEVIPEKYIHTEPNNSHYYKQGRIPVKYIRVTIARSY